MTDNHDEENLNTGPTNKPKIDFGACKQYRDDVLILDEQDQHSTEIVKQCFQLPSQINVWRPLITAYRPAELEYFSTIHLIMTKPDNWIDDIEKNLGKRSATATLDLSGGATIAAHFNFEFSLDPWTFMHYGTIRTSMKRQFVMNFPAENILLKTLFHSTFDLGDGTAGLVKIGSALDDGGASSLDLTSWISKLLADPNKPIGSPVFSMETEPEVPTEDEAA